MSCKFFVNVIKCYYRKYAIIKLLKGMIFMELKKTISRAFSAVTAAAMLITGFAVMPEDNDILETSAAERVVIDTTTEYQTIRGFGGINHPEWTGQEEHA